MERGAVPAPESCPGHTMWPQLLVIVGVPRVDRLRDVIPSPAVEQPLALELELVQGGSLAGLLRRLPPPQLHGLQKTRETPWRRMRSAGRAATAGLGWGDERRWGLTRDMSGGGAQRGRGAATATLRG